MTCRFGYGPEGWAPGQPTLLHIDLLADAILINAVSVVPCSEYRPTERRWTRSSVRPTARSLPDRAWTATAKFVNQSAAATTPKKFAETLMDAAETGTVFQPNGFF
jgi:hypothetical protein